MRRGYVTDGHIQPEQRDPKRAPALLLAVAGANAELGNPVMTSELRNILVANGWTDAQAAADVEEIVAGLIGEGLLVETTTDLFELAPDDARDPEDSPWDGDL